MLREIYLLCFPPRSHSQQRYRFTAKTAIATIRCWGSQAKDEAQVEAKRPLSEESIRVRMIENYLPQIDNLFEVRHELIVYHFSL